jgi:hypothetical protein
MDGASDMLAKAVRAFNIGDTHLLDGRFRSLRADSAQVTGSPIRSVESLGAT